MKTFKQYIIIALIVVCILLIIGNIYLYNMVKKADRDTANAYFERLKLQDDLIIEKERYESLAVAYKDADKHFKEQIAKITTEAGLTPKVIIVTKIVTNTIPMTVVLEPDGENFNIADTDPFITGVVYPQERRLDYDLKPHMYSISEARYDNGYWVKSVYDETVHDYALTIKDKTSRAIYLRLSKIVDVKFKVSIIEDVPFAPNKTNLVAELGLTGDSIFVASGIMWNKNIVKVSIDANRKLGGSYVRLFSIDNVLKKWKKDK
jgi:hypothetical protein